MAPVSGFTTTVISACVLVAIAAPALASGRCDDSKSTNTCLLRGVQYDPHSEQKVLGPRILESADECINSCNRKPWCTYFTYTYNPYYAHGDNPYRCFLFKGDSSPAVIHADERSISGPKICNSTVGCFNGWRQLHNGGSYCYKFLAGRLTWLEAVSTCRTLGGSLPRVDGDGGIGLRTTGPNGNAMNAALAHEMECAINDLVPEWKPYYFWIGLVRLGMYENFGYKDILDAPSKFWTWMEGKEGKCESFDSNIDDYRNWYRFQVLGDDDACAVVSVRDGKWFVQSCNGDASWAAVCQHPV